MLGRRREALGATAIRPRHGTDGWRGRRAHHFGDAWRDHGRSRGCCQHLDLDDGERTALWRPPRTRRPQTSRFVKDHRAQGLFRHANKNRDQRLRPNGSARVAGGMGRPRPSPSCTSTKSGGRRPWRRAPGFHGTASKQTNRFRGTRASRAELLLTP